MLQARESAQRGVFRPSLQLQIETVGKALLSRPGPGPADPIPVYVVDDGEDKLYGGSSFQQQQQQLAFVSMRQSRQSGNQRRASAASAASVASAASSAGDNTSPVVLQTLSTTTYRFGARTAAGCSWTRPGSPTSRQRRPSATPFVVLAVTTCLVMLKNETDRRRARRVAIMGGGLKFVEMEDANNDREIVSYLPFLRVPNVPSI